ncbi:type II secretion system secretin GspD [Inquilinus sp. Marseille-Q2685]|uniref:type II secretion system secretin GspD n=1 Tax=Inquilinus sp. Marseille-Q2685 TaxID=2866581 RepID=UPI001CE3EBAF|nr:type II secretion system secretin GspD [Inquilinus sp. Marseille-Q2685]
MFDDLANRSLAAPADARSRSNVVASAGRTQPVRQAQVYPGIDAVPGEPAPIGAPIQAQPGGYQVNFNNADLPQVVQAVLGDLLHQPYTIDPRVTGTVTLSTQGPISPNDLIAMLETVLRATGAALVQDGRAGYRIVPLGEAVSGRTVMQLGTDPKPLPAGYGITIIPLRNVSAETIGPLIAPATNPELVRVDPTRNLVLISGTSADRAALGATVQSFDVDWLRGMSSGVFPLRQAQPEAVIKELSAVFGGAPDRGPLKGLITFMPVERLNAVLVVSSRVDKLNEAGRWIRRLDQGDSDEERVYVYMVQNGTAANMARVLGQAFGKVDEMGASPFDDELGSDVARGLGLTTSSSNGTDQANAAGTGAQGTTGQTTPGQSGTGTTSQFAPIDFNAQQKDGDASILGLAGSQAGKAAVFRLDKLGEVRVVPDRDKNALLIRARPAAFRLIESALRAIDASPLQVVIEATIAEVTLNDRLQYGVQYYLETGFGAAGFTTRDPGSSPSGILGAPLPQAGSGLNLAVSTGGARVVLNALSSITNVRVVSAPTLSVLNNQTARLQVGNQVPVRTQQSQSTVNADSPVISNIEYKDTGVILKVTPRINSNSDVSMDVQQEVSSIVNDAASTEADALAPTISTRRIGSIVSVANGQTVVLGGLIQENQQNGRGGVPVLQDIPLLGNLFSSTSSSRDRTELVVFITPRVIRNAADAAAIAEELRSRMEALRPRTTTTRPRQL